MAIWPTDDPTQADAVKKLRPVKGAYNAGQQENVKRTEAEAADGQRRDVWGRTRFYAEGTMRGTIPAISVLYAFWKANRLLAFSFFDYDEELHARADYGAKTAGVNLTVTLPVKESRNVTVWLGGVVTGSWTLNAAAGAVGQDTLTVTAAGAGTVEIELLGRTLYSCEFVEPVRKSRSGYRDQTLAFRVREVM